MNNKIYQRCLSYAEESKWWNLLQVDNLTLSAEYQGCKAFLNPQIPGAESQCNLGTSKKGSKPCEYIPELSEGELPDRSFLWGVLRTLRNEAWQELFQNARKSRSSDVEEDNNEMIEIHLTMLDKLMKIQSISKGSLKFEDWINFNYRERTHSLSFEKKVFCIKEYKKEPKGVPSWSRVVKRK